MKEYSRRTLFGLVGLGAGLVVGAAVEAVVPGGLIRRGGTAIQGPSVGEVRKDYLEELNSVKVEQLIRDINNRRIENGLTSLQFDKLLSILALNAAKAAAEISSTGTGSRLRTLAQTPDQFIQDIQKLVGVEKYRHITVAADEVIDFTSIEDGRVEINDHPLIYSFESDEPVPLTPFLTNGDLNSIGAGVSLDEGNRIIFVVGGQKLS